MELLTKEEIAQLKQQQEQIQKQLNQNKYNQHLSLFDKETELQLNREYNYLELECGK